MQCLSPLGIWHNDPDRPGFTKFDMVPCGKCEACKENYIKDWTFRIQQDCENAYNAFFVTLTYNDENLPKHVNKEDVQNFFKRLRNRCVKFSYYGRTVRYFLTSEYGPLHDRPHYHAIIIDVVPLSGDPRDCIDQAWGKGFVTVEHIYGGAIPYVLKYVFKDQEGLSPELQQTIFHLQSKKLGQSFLNEHNKTNISRRRLTYIPIETRKARMPRYFQEKIYGSDGRRSVFGEARRLYESAQRLEFLTSTELRLRAIQEWQEQIDYKDDKRRRRFFQRLGIRYPR